MVTDATRRYRDLIAFALLAVAALYFVAALTLLFHTDSGGFADAGLGFADKAALSGYLFTAVAPILSLVVAVLLVTRYGDPGPSTRIVVLAALGIAGLDALFALITFFAQLGSDLQTGFQNAIGGGKAVGVLLGLAHLGVIAIACLYLYTALRSLPAPVPAAAAQAPWGQPGYGAGASGWGAPIQPGSPDAQGSQGAQSWWQQPAAGYAWAPSDQAPGAAWGSPPPAGTSPVPGAAPGGWGDPSPSWADATAAQQGQPASSWTSGSPEWSSQGEEDQQQDQPSWAQPSAASAGDTSSADTSAGATQWAPQDSDDRTAPYAETTADATGNAGDPAQAGSYAGESAPVEGDARELGETDSEQEPPAERGGWWRRPEN